jgi:hypothetical protein
MYLFEKVILVILPISFALKFVWLPKKFNVHFCQKSTLCLASAAPRLENPNAVENDALFGRTPKTI